MELRFAGISTSGNTTLQEVGLNKDGQVYKACRRIAKDSSGTELIPSPSGDNDETQVWHSVLQRILEESLQDIDGTWTEMCTWRDPAADPSEGAVFFSVLINPVKDGKKPSVLRDELQAQLIDPASLFRVLLGDEFGGDVVVDETWFRFSLVGSLFGLLLELELWQVSFSSCVQEVLPSSFASPTFAASRVSSSSFASPSPTDPISHSHRPQITAFLPRRS